MNTFIPTSHTNSSFNKALNKISKQLTDMSTRCEKSLVDACKAIETCDSKISKGIYTADTKINELEEKIIMNVATTIARHSPVAHDLHSLMGSVKLAQELERLADHAKNIGRRVVWLSKFKAEVAYKEDMLLLGNDTLNMLSEFLQAVNANDDKKIKSVMKKDKAVNKTYLKIMDNAFGGVTVDNPRVLINSVFIAKNFERIGDKIKNLAEIALYQKTGKIHDIERADLPDN